MKKIAIILDSMCGTKRDQVLKMGFYFVAQKLILNDKKYDDGVDITYAESKGMIDKSSSIKTSMPPIGEISDLFEKLSKEYESVVYLPVNKGLSSTYSSSKAVSQNFPNVFVVNNRFVGTQFLKVAKHIKKLAQENTSIRKIIKVVEDLSSRTITYTLVEHLENLIKSGRLMGVKKAILKSIKIIPKLLVSDNGFVVKNFKRNYSKMISSTVENLVKKEVDNPKKFDFMVFSTLNKRVDSFVRKAFKDLNVIFASEPVPSVVGAHAGNGAVGISAFPKITVAN